jgi:hypothetical protein
VHTSASPVCGLERNLHENLPIGPEEGQTFYLGIQVAKDICPPPY